MDNSLEREALAAMNAAEKLYKQDKLHAAEFKLHEAAELYSELQDANPQTAYMSLPNVYHHLATIARKNGNRKKECEMVEKAIASYKRVLEARPEETYVQIAIHYIILSFAQEDLQLDSAANASYREGVNWYIKSLERGYDVDSYQIYQLTHGTNPKIAYNQSLYPALIAAYKKGGKIRRSLLWDGASLIEEAGKWLHKKGEDEQALNHFIEAVQIYQQATHEEQVTLQVRLAQVISQIANIYDDGEHVQKAFDCFGQAAGLYDDLAKRNLEGNPWMHAYVHYRAGILAVSYLNNLPKSVYHLKAALPIWEAIAQQDKGELHYVAETRFYLGYCMGSVEPKVSIEEFQKAKAIFKQCTDDDYSAQINQIDQILAQNFGIR